jgi:vitamin B12 transporter
MEKKFLIVMMISLQTIAFAGDTLHIKSIEITATPNYITTKQDKIDSLTTISLQFNSLDAALMQESGMTIKTYGLGMLASPSLRGGSAQQTAVLWHGLNIQNSMLGQVDLSSIPLGMFTNASVDYTSQTNGGLNATSGSIALKDNTNNPQRFEIGSSVSTLQGYSNLFKANFAGKKFSSHSKIFHLQSENKYAYKNYLKPTHPAETMQGAQQNMLVLMQDLNWTITEKNKIETSVWFTQRHRNIPPTILQHTKSALQVDNSFKAIIESKNQLRCSVLNARFAYLKDVLNYTDTGITGNNRWNGIVAETDWKKKLSAKHELSLFYNLSTFNGISNSYLNKNNTQQRQSISANYLFTMNNSLFFAANASAIQINFKEIAPQLKLQIDKQFEVNAKNKVALKAALYNAYRYPTLNDLYWNPGGNINLQPEKSLCAETNLAYETNNFSGEVSAFSKHVNNWIIWLPTNGYWSPINAASVWSRGFESTVNYKQRMNQVTLKLKLIYAYILSTNQKSTIANDVNLYKQLIYVPLYKTTANISLCYKTGFLNISNQYTGYRFTSADNKQFLNPYLVSNATIGYGFHIKKVNAQTTLSINNIFNTEYESIAYRPMPLRYVELSIKLNF